MKHPVRLYRWSWDMEDHVAYTPCGECPKCLADNRDRCEKSVHLPRATAREVYVDAETVVRVQMAAHDPRIAEVIQSAGGSAYVDNPVREVEELCRKARQLEPYHAPVAPDYTPTCSADYAADILQRFSAAQSRALVGRGLGTS